MCALISNLVATSKAFSLESLKNKQYTVKANSYDYFGAI